MKSDYTPMNSAQDWFCYDSYFASGRPKMEAELFDYAKKMLMYRLITEANFQNVLNMLALRQDCLAEMNPRWKRVDFRFSSEMNGVCWLRIGAVYLSLRKVLGNF